MSEKYPGIKTLNAMKSGFFYPNLGVNVNDTKIEELT